MNFSHGNPAAGVRRNCPTCINTTVSSILLIVSIVHRLPTRLGTLLTKPSTYLVLICRYSLLLPAPSVTLLTPQLPASYSLAIHTQNTSSRPRHELWHIPRIGQTPKAATSRSVSSIPHRGSHLATPRTSPPYCPTLGSWSVLNLMLPHTCRNLGRADEHIAAEASHYPACKKTFLCGVQHPKTALPDSLYPRIHFIHWLQGAFHPSDKVFVTPPSPCEPSNLQEECHYHPRPNSRTQCDCHR